MEQERCRGLVAVMREQGRTWAWLARATGYKYHTIWKVKVGQRQPSAAFRAAVAQALGMDEGALFLADECVE